MSQLLTGGMVDTDASAPRLKESIVKDALSTLCWGKLEGHLDCPPTALMRQIGWVEEGRISGSS